jgi:8-oxo-dGTP diphosphatase
MSRPSQRRQPGVKMSDPLVVVGAAILHHGRLLAAQRSEPPQLAGGWELPGGKVEPDEGELDALVRECREELGVEIGPRDRLGGDWPLANGMIMRVWTADLLAGEPAPIEDHMACRWLTPETLYDVAWLPADLPIVADIARVMENHR